MKNLFTVRSCSCVNTRDNRGGNTCVSQLNYGLSCKNFLGWKDCDRQCNLCACSTASGITQEHCNGRGTCEATCTQYTCTGAKCKCDPGWSGDKCQNRKKMIAYIYIYIYIYTTYNTSMNAVDMLDRVFSLFVQ